MNKIDFFSVALNLLVLVILFWLRSSLKWQKKRTADFIRRNADLVKIMDHKDEFIASQKRELILQFETIQNQTRAINDQVREVNRMKVEMDKANRFTEILSKKFPYQAEVARKIFIGKYNK